MKLRPVIFWVHLATGLIIGSVVFVMAVTGVLIAFEPQIVEFAERGVRYVPLPESRTPRLKAGEIVASASRFRQGGAPTGLSQDANPGASAVVLFGREGGVFVNPYTGEALGSISKIHQFMHKLIEIHRWLGSRAVGKPVANVCNAAFFIMIVSGFYLWWPKQWSVSVRKAIMFFNPALEGKAKDWNWHNVIGFWTFPLLFVTSLTGLVISYTWANNLLFRITGSEPPPAIQRPKEMKQVLPKGIKNARVNKSNDEKPAADFDKLWVAAESQVKDWQSISLRLPREAGDPVTASIVENGAKSFMRSQLTLLPETGGVVKWEPFATQSTGKKVRSWVVPVHTGEAWGLPGQMLMLVGALGAATLVWTGFSLSYRRFFQAKAALTLKN